MHHTSTRQMAGRLHPLENSSKLTEMLWKLSECIQFLLLKSEKETKQVSVVAMVSCKNILSTKVSQSQHLCIASHKPTNSILIYETFLLSSIALHTDQLNSEIFFLQCLFNTRPIFVVQFVSPFQYLYSSVIYTSPLVRLSVL